MRDPGCGPPLVPPLAASAALLAAFGAFGAGGDLVPGYLLTLVSRAPVTATCADVPGAVDYVLTPADVQAINARMAQINAYMQARAAERGYAYFALSAIYDQPKPRLDRVLSSNQPFGGTFSFDGVHPSAAGQGALAAAAAAAVNARYGLAIP